MSDPPADRFPGDLARRIAHAMRTPLGVVRGALRESAGQNEALQRRMLELGERAATQLERLADRLSMLGRLDGGIDPSPIACEVDGLLASAAERVARTRVRRGIEVELGQAPAVTVAVDTDLMTEAIVEVVDNAVRCAKTRVWIAASTQDEGVVVRVENDGPEPNAATITAALDRTVALEDRTGLGVGLWMADRITRAHGGELRHRAGGGLVVFEFVLPRSSPSGG